MNYNIVGSFLRGYKSSFGIGEGADNRDAENWDDIEPQSPSKFDLLSPASLCACSLFPFAGTDLPSQTVGIARVRYESFALYFSILSS